MTSKIRALEHLAEDLRENGYAMQSDAIHALIAERDAARDDALEEAAKRFDEKGKHLVWAEDAAAAIRAMKGSKP